MTSSQQSKRDRTLRWLREGYGLDLKFREGDASQVTPSRVIWRLIEDATQTIEKTPDEERRWLTSGLRSGGWNSIGLTASEAWEIERIRMLSAMTPQDGPIGMPQPQGSDIERALDVLEWLRYCSVARQPLRLQKAAYALARGGETEAVRRIYAPNRKSHDRQIAFEIRTRATGYIMSGLKTDLDIIAYSDGRFRESHVIAA